MKSYKFRIYPNGQQIQTLNQTIETCRLLYNESFEERRKDRGLSYYDQKKQLTQIALEDVISVEYVDLSKSQHKTDNVSNVFYGSQTNKGNSKKAKAENNDAFYRWIKSLSPRKDVQTETHHFQYTRRTKERK